MPWKLHDITQKNKHYKSKLNKKGDVSFKKWREESRTFSDCVTNDVKSWPHFSLFLQNFSINWNCFWPVVNFNYKINILTHVILNCNFLTYKIAVQQLTARGVREGSFYRTCTLVNLAMSLWQTKRNTLIDMAENWINIRNLVLIIIIWRYKTSK